jgi:hypothetical protein
MRFLFEYWNHDFILITLGFNLPCQIFYFFIFCGAEDQTQDLLKLTYLPSPTLSDVDKKTLGKIAPDPSLHG